MRKIIVGAFIGWALLTSLGTHAQSFITGRVIAASTGEPVTDASVSLGFPESGTITNLRGEFRLQAPEGSSQLQISRIGFESLRQAVEIKKNETKNLGTLELAESVVALREVHIISSVAQQRHTPVAIDNITATAIQQQLGDRPFPEIMQTIPGVFARRTGGGSGDAAISIRGFSQENVALLLNGIPISSVENGLVYWNNWIGLADATRSIQVQRGLGVSNVALNSVGGTINIITKATEAEKGGSISFANTSYGNSKLTLALNTGKLENGVAVSFLGSRTQGPGYVDATYVDAWAYFMSVSKSWNNRHTLVFTALGAPERHGQRTLKLSDQEIKLHGKKYNKDWGSYNGIINNASENYYHKPYITLNHYWNISERLFLATSAYYSPGYGGGKWSESSSYAPSIFDYRNESGQIDWQTIYHQNANNTLTDTLANGQVVSGFSQNIQTDFLASHQWGGLLQRLEYTKSDALKLTAGIHLRYFQSTLQEKVRDLLGGGFFIDDFAYAIDGVAGRSQIKTVGDIIKIDNGAINPSASIFGQAEYTKNTINAFISGTFTNMWYQRTDNYNYTTDTRSELLLRTGFDTKGGISWQLAPRHQLYFNTGYFSRTPYFKYVFGNFSNVPVKNLENEKVASAEIGYGYSDNRMTLRANVYYSLWIDKSFLSNEYVQLANNTQTRALVTGLDALHTGIEAEASFGVSQHLQLGALASVGNWRWKNNVSAVLFNDNNTAVDTVSVFANDLFVGGAPLVQAGINGRLQVLKTFTITANWMYYAKQYADFDPARRNDPTDLFQPWQLPDYGILDAHINFPFRLASIQAQLGISGYNITDARYWVGGEDGTGHDLQSFRGFPGFGRTFSVMLRVEF
jgi:hypothetical protein